MRELNDLLKGLIRGDRSFEEASRGLERFLAENADGAASASRMLHEAREAGLAHHVYVALAAQLTRTGPDPTGLAGEDAPAAVRTGPGGEDATALGDDGAPAPARAAQQPDDDMTRMDAMWDGERTAVLGHEAAPAAGTDAGSGAVEPPGPDVSAAAGVDPDATVMDAMPDDERTVMDAGDGETTGGGELGAGARTDASAPTPTPSRHARPAGSVPGLDRDFEEGDLLRGRFELISKLGEGGMGAVWKGKDKLKEEARDRNPFVAIKLLQGDFKSHPEAFIALQRETAKQQRLAHPNIATVFDFDRDDANGTVFMTMEVLEGQPLDAFIRKLPADGLPEEEAMPLIEQLCLGLGYAHKAGLVHSDLKPGNAFLTKEGNIKLLDFGIARASKTKTDAEGETTLFDPGQLGALTPTYATIEMFEGEEPDQRDDVYALAIMAYQLLTGRHPYGKQSAPKAMELGLEPEPVHKLSKRQNRGLMRGLAFHRDERTGSVEEFLDSITRKPTTWPLYAGGAALAIALVAAAAWPTISGKLDAIERETAIEIVTRGGLANLQQGLEHARTLGDAQLARVLDDPRVVEAVSAFITTGGERSVAQGLALLRTYPAEWQDAIKDVDAVRRTVLDTYQARIDAGFMPAQGRYDFPAANAHLEELDALYPDSAEVLRMRNALSERRSATLAELGERYNTLLAAGRLLPVEGEDDIADPLAVVRAIDPEHALLKDEQVRFRFTEEIERAMGEQDYARADALLDASAAYEVARDDPRLKELRWRLDRELLRIANEKRVTELEEQLAAAETGLTTLADYQGVRDALIALSNLSPQSAVLERIRGQLKKAFENALAGHVAARRWQQAEALLFDFARLLPVPDLTRHRLALSRAEAQAGFAPDLAAREPLVRERVGAVEALLDDPEFGLAWEAKLEEPYKELIALQPLDAPALVQVRNRVGRLMLSAARQAREKKNFDQAREFVTKGLDLFPGLSNLTDEREAIAAQEEAFLAARAQQERDAKVARLKSEFAELAAAGDVQAARGALKEVQALGVPGNDPFLAEEAPAVLSTAYQRLAGEAAASGNFDAAAALQTQSVELDPASEDKRERLAEHLAASLDGADASRESELKRIAKPMQLLRSLAPARAAPLDRAMGDRALQAVNALEARDRKAAAALLALAQAAIEHAGLDGKSIEPQELETARRQIAAYRLAAARASIAAARAAAPKDPGIPRVQAQLAQARAAADAAYREHRQIASDPKGWSRKRELAATFENATRLCVDCGYARLEPPPPPRWLCRSEIAGFGKRSRGQCWDEVGGARGPTMVVVPAPAGGAPYAIGKYEVSRGDIALYCRSVGNRGGACESASLAATALPATGLTAQQIGDYATWLSEQASRALGAPVTYRLATGAEWQHAATADGVQPKTQFNCRVREVPGKGEELLEVASGRSNAWGLANHVGNARELVREGGGFAARGGAYTMPLTACDVSISEPHDGGADDITGFRLVREVE